MPGQVCGQAQWVRPRLPLVAALPPAPAPLVPPLPAAAAAAVPRAAAPLTRLPCVVPLASPEPLDDAGVCGEPPGDTEADLEKAIVVDEAAAGPTLPFLEQFKLLASGGVAGAFSKSCTAPLARLTILYQVRQGCRPPLLLPAASFAAAPPRRATAMPHYQAFYPGLLLPPTTLPFPVAGARHAAGSSGRGAAVAAGGRGGGAAARGTARGPASAVEGQWGDHHPPPALFLSQLLGVRAGTLAVAVARCGRVLPAWGRFSGPPRCGRILVWRVFCTCL